MASAATTGTLNTATVANLRAGGKTIILTLTADTWVASGATFNAQRQNIINGIASDRAEAAGFAALLSTIPVTAVVQTSTTVVTITLPALPTYYITGQEDLTVTIPSTAVAGGVAIVSAGACNIVPGGVSAALTGTLPGMTEAQVQAGGGTLIVTLTGDSYVASGGTFDAQRQNILNGIASDRAEAAGMVAEIAALPVPVTAVVRTSATVVTITMPALPGYQITGPEKLSVVIPATAVLGANALTTGGGTAEGTEDTLLDYGYGPASTNLTATLLTKGATPVENAMKHYHGRNRKLRQANFVNGALGQAGITSLFPTGVGTATGSPPQI